MQTEAGNVNTGLLETWDEILDTLEITENTKEDVTESLKKIKTAHQDKMEYITINSDSVRNERPVSYVYR